MAGSPPLPASGEGHGRAPSKWDGLAKTGKGYKEYNIRLKQFSYSPEVIRVERGDRVRLNLESVDVQHGFYIDGYDLHIVVPEGEPQSIEFLADKAGAFRIRCSSTCGPFHPFMVGKLVVEPNYRFWGALAAVILVPLGTLAYLAYKGEEL